LSIGFVAVSAQRTAAAQTVDLALVLGIDCSYSVDQTEYDLQVDGLASAFRNSEVIAAIAAGRNRRIGVSLVQWADSLSQVTVIPWRVVGGVRSAQQLAGEIARTPRMVSGGGTSITGIIAYGYRLLGRLPFAARRMAIDIVADGRNNNGGDPRAARDLLGSQGITINGLTILNEIETLDIYFRRNIVGGPGHFVIKANGYEQFDEAILRKLRQEILGPGIATLPGVEHVAANLTHLTGPPGPVGRRGSQRDAGHRARTVTPPNGLAAPSNESD
jgi:hypothetical protein